MGEVREKCTENLRRRTGVKEEWIKRFWKQKKKGDNVRDI